LIVGDFTASIGDPTGKNKTRPPLSKEQIEENSKTYIGQLSKVLDISKVDVRHNSEWLGNMVLSDVIKLLASYNLGRMLMRDDFRKRYENEIPIAMHELVYPLLQGYDSLAIKADVEIGGTDQLFNLQVGRYLQEVNGLPSQAIMCMPLLRGTDGVNKMSKSLNNYIGLIEDPRQVFGKVMSLPDDLLVEYIDLVSSFDGDTRNSMKEQLSGKINPMEIKKELAYDIVRQFHSVEIAEQEKEFFYNQFQNKDKDNIEYEDVSLSGLGLPSLDIVSLLIALKVRDSKSACRALIEQGGVAIDDSKITDYKYEIDPGKEHLMKCGKMGFYRVLP
jgi:tyrosyl-tRNA synthetase